MQATLKKLRDNLVPLYGKGETEAIIRIIFHYLKDWSLTDMLIHSQDELSPFIKEEIDKIIQRLKNFEPIQYITGEARFHGLELKVKPGVLIPRRETEELVDIIAEENKDRSDLKILDLCTGSGCIALALAKCMKFPVIDAVDISEIALNVAKENANLLKVKINLIQDDVFSFHPHTNYDIIVSNPPYIAQSEAMEMEKNVLDYEPHSALFVPDDNPLIFYSRIGDIAKSSLNKRGILYLEINPRFADLLKIMLMKKGFAEVEIIRDSFGKERFIVSRN